MGSILTFSNNPTLPIPILATDLLEEKQEAIIQYRNDLRELGVSVIEVDDSFSTICDEYKKQCGEWLNSTSLNEKKKYESYHKDQLLKEIGRKLNHGYVFSPNKSEYLKYKILSGVEEFPNTKIYNIYQQLSNAWKTVVEKCIDITCSEKAIDNKTQQLSQLVDSKEIEDMKTFGLQHSSISLIHYFKKNEKNENQMTEDEKLCNRTKEIPLGEHEDTGVLTFILCSNVSGLQIFDRKSEKYYFCENYFKPNKYMFVIAGKKLSLFSWKKVINPTWHSVSLPTSTERYSLLYFVEIVKDV